MDTDKTRGPLLDHLDALEALCVKGDPSLKDILNIFGPEGHYILIFFLIIPFLQPIPLIGLSTPFGIVIAIVGSLAYIGKPALMPKQWAAKVIPADTVLKIAEGSECVVEKLRKFIHPRMTFLFNGQFRYLNMVLLVISAMVLALPLPIPFSNTMPAWVIMFQTVAHLERDGLFVVLSYVQTAVCIGYFFLIAEGVGRSLELFNAFV